MSEKEVLLSMINKLDKRLDKIEEELKELREEMNEIKERIDIQELRFKTIIDVERARDIRKEEEEKIYEMYQVREGTGFATTRKKWVRHPFF